jgi:hypothetical protein
MTAYQVIPTQPNRLLTPSVANETQLDDNGNQIVTFATVAKNQAACMGIDHAQTETVRNFPDAQKNLALCVAYLLAATDRDFRPLTMDRRKVDDRVRASHAKLWRLWQIRSAAKTWVPLLRSTQPNDPLVIKAAAEAAELLEEVMR